MTQPDPVEQHFVLYFDESLRGLSVGAPVTLFGLTVGHVAEVGLAFDQQKLSVRPRVLITFLPERLTEQLVDDGRGASVRHEAMSPAARAACCVTSWRIWLTRSAADRQPDHRRAVCGFEYVPNSAQAEDRLES